MFQLMNTVGVLVFIVCMLMSMVFLAKRKDKFKNIGKAVLTSFALFLVFFMSGCSSKDKVENKTSKDSKAAISDSVKDKSLGTLKVHYIDVGQADSILLQQNGHNMLIDAGNNEDSNLVKKYLQDQGVTNLEFLVGTHPHEDHIGGMDYVINSFKIGKVYMPKVTSTTKTFRDVVNATKNKGLKFTNPNVGDSFKLGDAKCTILSPKSSSYKSLNDYSIVIKVEFGENSFLFTGDAQGTSEMEMVKANLDLKADVLKVGHHGSRTSTVSNFLEKVNPKYAVVSVGKDNDYRHPHQGVMDRLKSKNINVYRTDENGTVIATSDGKTIKFNCKPGSYKGNSTSSKSSSSSTSVNSSTSNSSSTKTSNSSSQNETRTVKQESTNSSNQSSSVSESNQNKVGETVWISATGKKYHSRPDCGRMNPNKARKMNRQDAENAGYQPCKKCY
ncbi:MBL fold metallo-hydrolase [Clostridium oceanicum]|uniref:Metallo-beta-lactamase domain-containing protein n=1 Tax=Clostridium oceanicum TaxID=1543 RepID=A0ABP3UMB0_9CLOT